jgi:hypothetical protein
MGAEEQRHTVSERVKSQFGPAYLTLTSIIQGVALSTLVMRVEATYGRFDAADWLLAAATFVVIIDVWHEYLMMVLAYVWQPTLLDSLVPFAFLAAEVFMAHFVFDNLRDWLLAFAAANAVGIAAWRLQVRQTQTLVEENRDVRDALARQNSWRGMAVLAIAIFSLAAFSLYDVLRLGRVSFVLAAVTFVAVAAFLGTSVPYLNQLLAYLRDEPTTKALAPSGDQEPSAEEALAKRAGRPSETLPAKGD